MSLPPSASLEQLRKRAKDLLRAHQAGSAEAVARVAAVLPGAEIRLAQAQLVVAREHGFPSWPRLRAHLERVAVAGPSPEQAFEEDPAYYAERAVGLLESARDGTPDAVAAFTRRAAPLTPAGARRVVAGNHGFTSWAGLRRHLRSLGDEPFARAFRALRNRDVDGLGALLDRFPELVAARGTNGNDLLALASATRDERLVSLLVGRGADVARGNRHGWTALHQAGYANLPRMARVLLDAGAPLDVSARGDGGTPLVAALFWGHREVAELLGTAPRNLRVAAGLDDVALVDELWATPAAGAHRGFYRPHGGFPAWQPSDSAAEVRDEAVSWAARSGSVAAMTALVERGAAVDANVYRGTALTWAAANGRVAAVRRLLELGAEVNLRGTFGGPAHGVGTTALHHAAESGHLEVIEVLLAAGADRTVTDALYGVTPESWAEHNDQREAVGLLRSGRR
ncbi:ankyrin repeat domain-containing protein [Actinophytocola gossypii]|uniref:Ankyrin repeat domain-containing protein n=1 Tax=Actinophytocola gossypii TaxID=2812003 RepID=A0ABT2J6J5_9PSEU|nr:ankyrin repeat domain-containing protein [Actinophytocola gossypii]MCT2583219.1 ankyrin repeat domain-containing protein [Actinophytocola gossypii]